MDKNKTYLVSFLVTQRGNHTSWIEDVIQSGLREGETLDTLCITELEGVEHE
jgi:hypothetical protein